MIDANTFKQGLYFSGTGLKIFSLQKLIRDKPEYIFLTAWNFKDEIVKNLKKLRVKSKYIIPIPKAKIIK